MAPTDPGHPDSRGQQAGGAAVRRFYQDVVNGRNMDALGELLMT
jgi:ribulose 1,5-bisphosphate carboxylase large subunit-like protein